MLHHVTFEVRPGDREATAAFYELLGFRRAEPPPSLRGRALWLERDGSQVHLKRVDDPVVMPEGHAAFVVPDFEAALERLRAAGHEPEPRERHWGSPRAFVRDPAGNLVEVMEFPPGGSG
jgi:catechol 2,3-dioxygenase-like lactoylglutathione lyase family enzyme